jgi:RHS repeat-associated protein
MAGISSKALNGDVVNRKKFNGIEHNTDFDLNIYDAVYRNLDPQIGRFWQVDPEAESLGSYSPYESMGNNPISHIDPLGDFKTWFGAFLHKVSHGGGKIGQNNLGEYFVRKVSTSAGFDGNVTVVAKVTYGSDRNKYSNYLEDLANNFDETNQINDFARLGMWDKNLSSNAAKQNLLNNSIGLSLPNIQLKTTVTHFRSFLNKLLPSKGTLVKPGGNLTINSDIVLSGGRNGKLVKDLEGPAHSVIKGSEGRIYITDESGKVVWDITKERAKSVIPGQGFGPKVPPTQEQLELLNKVWGGMQ